jgi:hypothetical protein
VSAHVVRHAADLAVDAPVEFADRSKGYADAAVDERGGAVQMGFRSRG